MMTWPEVKAALAAGKTTAIVYTGGTEQRGPQNVNGGHTLMARATAKAIALKLGNAIVMPTLAYSPNRASADLPGTIGLSNEVFGQMLTEISEQAIITGFKNVMIMGDHGGGQPTVFAEVAKKLDAEVRAAGQARLLRRRGLREGAGRLRQVARSRNGYPRQLARRHPRHLDDAVSRRRQGLGPQGADRDRRRRSGSAAGRARSGRGTPDPNAPPRKNNGISGDARRSSIALGKQAFDIKVDYAVKQITGFLANQPKATTQQ